MSVKDDAIKRLDPISRWEQEIGAIYDLVSAGPRVVFQEAGFMALEPEIVPHIQYETGLFVAGYLHIMDTDSIRHIIKSHGTQSEILRGQVALVRTDFFLLLEIFSRPDTIENGGKTKQGRDTIKYSKTLSGFLYCYTEELRTKKNRLAAVTFYKRKS